MNPVFLRVSLGYFRRHLLQTCLLVLGIALGVAVVIAVDLANTGAARSFQLSTQTLTGKATHRLTGGRRGISEQIYAQIKLKYPDIPAAPVVTGFVSLQEKNQQQVRLLGIDPFAEGPFRAYLPLQATQSMEALLPLLTGESAALVSKQFQAGLPNQTQQLTLQSGKRVTRLKISGLLSPSGSWEQEGLRQVILTDPGTAQQVLGQIGFLSQIDLILRPEQIAQLKAGLPPDIQLNSTQTQNQALQSMTQAFSLNLSALSLLALLVGMFLVYNTVTFSVVQRRSLLGTLRSLGVTRREIFALILVETTALALLGLVAGTALGIWMGQIALQLVLNTIQDLYFKLEVSRFQLAPLSLIKGWGAGGLAALLASALPAWEAAQSAPTGTLRRSVLEEHVQKLLPGLLLGGALSMGLGILLMAWPGENLIVSFAGFFALVSGAALMIPGLTPPLMQIMSQMAGKNQLLLRMAPRNVARALSRTGVSIAALMVAVSVVVSVNIMIGSFRITLVDWLEGTLSADIYLTLAERDGQQDLPLNLRQEISQWPGVSGVESARNRSLDQPNYGRMQLFVLSRDTAPRRPFVWTDTTPKNRQSALAAGGVFISQPFAYRHKFQTKSGQSLLLQTEKGPQRFAIRGIYHDYVTGPGSVLMADSVYRRFWQDNGIDSLAVFVEKPQTLEKILTQLEKELSPRYPVNIQSNRALRTGALAIFDRTFAITGALRLLAVIVALMGIFSTLLSLQLERTREFGLLRALGLSDWQLSGLILLESGAMGLAAGLFALPLGTGLSWALIYVINLRSFGWLLDFRPSPAYYLQALGIAVGAALLAGLWPAWKLSRLSPAEALKYE
ncbi:MAG: ABC transporter permease [Candidatus Sericytochromatia bacterium]|nr:ABC transporter permease [Candidatus Sericytochromatia bacterium]